MKQALLILRSFLLFFLICCLQSCVKGPLTDQWWLIPLFLIILIPGFMFIQGDHASKLPRAIDDYSTNPPTRTYDDTPRKWYQDKHSWFGFGVMGLGIVILILRLIFWK